MTSSTSDSDKKYTFIVEHLDPELEDWQALEYKCISDESSAANAEFLLTGIKTSDVAELLEIPESQLTDENVESLFQDDDERNGVCLLDPKAEHDLSPEDGEKFDVFLFGGILGDDPPRGAVDEVEIYDRECMWWLTRSTTKTGLANCANSDSQAED